MAAHVGFFSHLFTPVLVILVSTRSLVVNAIAFAVSGLTESLLPRSFRRRRMKTSLLSSVILYSARVSLSRVGFAMKGNLVKSETC